MRFHQKQFHCIKVRYSIQLGEKIYVKGYGFLSFAINMTKNVSNKYGQKLLDSAKISTTDLIQTGSKRAIQKTVEATGNFIGNKIGNKITSVSKKSPKELNSTELHTKELQNNEMKAPKKETHILRRKATSYL